MQANSQIIFLLHPICIIFAFMKTVKINGSLGQQMFQYAFFLAVDAAYPGETRMTGKKLLPQEIFTLAHGNKFDPQGNSNWLPWKNNQYKNFATISEPANGAFDADIIKNAPQNAVFDGNWTSYRYFDDIEEEVCRQFNFISPVAQQAAVETVAMHVINPSSRLNPCTRDYYNWAVANINTFLPETKFQVITDDPKWVQRNIVGLPSNTTMLNSKNMTLPTLMQLMSTASHNIISSTLTDWWAAYLNRTPDKIIIAPQRWNIETAVTDLLPMHWTIIPVT